ESGQPRRWVEPRQGSWDHADWLSLLATLRGSEYWPMHPGALSVALDQVKRGYGMLRRGGESAHPPAGSDSCQGRWNQADWLALLETLRESEFWPMDPDALSGVLDQVKREVELPPLAGVWPAPAVGRVASGAIW